MKKFTICLMMMCLSLMLFPLLSNAATTTAISDSLTVAKSPEFTEGKSLEVRSNESNVWNKSKFKMANKNSPQQIEVVSGRHHRHGGNVVFITGGGVLLIVLLLVILL